MSSAGEQLIEEYPGRPPTREREPGGLIRLHEARSDSRLFRLSPRFFRNRFDKRALWDVPQVEIQDRKHPTHFLRTITTHRDPDKSFDTFPILAEVGRDALKTPGEAKPGAEPPVSDC